MDDRQWDIDGRLTVGPGTDTRVTNVRGLGSPNHVTSRAKLPNNHGGVAGDDWADFHTLELDLVYHGTAAEVQERLDLLNELCQPGSTDRLWSFSRPGKPGRLRFVRPEPLVERLRGGGTILEARLRGRSVDPVTYSATLRTATLLPFSGVGFAEYPEDPSPGNLTFGDYPKLYTGGGSGGGVNVTNGGTWPVWPRFVIPGPSAGTMNVERLENATAGRAVQFTADGGLQVPAGQTLVVDMHPSRRLVRFLSGADRLNTLVDLDSWWQLEPGVSELRLRASGDIGAVATVQWRDGWL